MGKIRAGKAGALIFALCGMQINYMNIQKDFDGWNMEKKRFHLSEKPDDFYYHEREVWWCAIGANIGVETDGKHNSFERPILVLKKFNKEMFWGIPLTSRKREGTFYTEAGNNSWAMLSQLRTWSSKRLLRRIGMLSKEDFESIILFVRELL